MTLSAIGLRRVLRGPVLALRRTAVLALGICLALGALPGDPAQASERQRQRLVIHNDYGGSVPARAQQIATMRARGQSVAVPSGHCMSSCTMYLGLPGTCVGPTAVFGFHGPSAQSGLGLPKAEFERWSQVMAANYPPSLRGWFLQTGRYNTIGYQVITGAQLIQMGVPRCL